MKKIASRLPASAWLAGIFLFALAIRCVGLSWGGVHADENVGDAARVLTGELVPVSHYYPPLLNYLTAAGYVVLFGVGWLTNWWSSVSEFRAAYFDHPELFLLVLRSVVAVTGAVAAPLSAMISRRLGLSKWGSAMVGLAIALLPLSVWRSHFGKSDLGVAAGVLLMLWAFLRYTNGFRRADVIWLGVASAIAVSFKHSALFLIGPLALAFVVVARWRSNPWPKLGRDLVVAVGVGFLCWIPLNLGIWLDLRNFLEFQKIQSAMSVRDSTLVQTAAALWGLLGNRISGPTVVLLAGFVLAPLWWRRAEVLAVWASLLASIAVIAYISGDRAVVRLYTPQSVVMAVFGMMAWVQLAEQSGARRWLGGVAVVLALSVLVAGAFKVKRQALGTPMRSRVAEALLAIEGIGKRKILASDLRQVGLPVSGDADRATMARSERLATLYDVKLPKRYQTYAPNENRYFIRSFPWVIGGLEFCDATDLKQIKPFAWPLQPEEWELNYWLQKGYSVFVIKNEAEMLAINVPAYRNLHAAIRDRGTLVATIPADRPLFGEFEAKVYRFALRGKPSEGK